MDRQKSVVEKVVNYIEANMEQEINLENISRQVGYSKFYLNRIFMEETGFTIYKYLQSRRLTMAAEQLVKTDKPITQISYEAGYQSQQAFSLAFKQMYCYPPKVYRKRGIFVPKQEKLFIRTQFYSVMAGKFLRESEEMAA